MNPTQHFVRNRDVERQFVFTSCNGNEHETCVMLEFGLNTCGLNSVPEVFIIFK